MALKNEIVELLQHNRNNILEGKVNCIPSPFRRFRFDFPGIRQATYYLVSGNTKAAKSQLTQYMFVFNTIIYWLENPTKVSKPKIFMFPLEESVRNITLRYYCYLYYKLYGQRFSPLALQSIDEEHPIPQEVIDRINTDTSFAKYANAFEECVEFREERNATGIYHVVKDYMESHGKVLFKQEYYTFTDELGIKHENEPQTVFDKYIPDDENQYVIPIVDHVGLLQLERGVLTLKDNIEKLSSYFVKLRNRYGITPVVVQQQNSETSGLDAVKAGRILATKNGLKDSKRTAEDCTVFIGITNPMAYGVASFPINANPNYSIVRLKDHFRIMEIVLNREGKANGLCPLFFDGAVNSFIELPKPNDNQMGNVYDYVERLNNSMSFFIFSRNTKLNKQKKHSIKVYFKYLCKRFKKYIYG